MTEQNQTQPECTFADLGLGKNVLRAVEKLGYSAPTPVQAQAIPLVLDGVDVAAAAQTGTGKTAAFALPLMDAIPRVKKHAKPQILVVVPTRELAQQVGDVCQAIAEFSKHRILTVVGGLSYNPQIEKLKKGVDVLIATPGRLIDLIGQEAVDLGYVKALVLDEADLMMDMGFWPDVKRIITHTPEDRQTLLFSATLDPKVISGPQSPLTSPELVEIAHKGQTADKVAQYMIPVSQQVKPLLLAGLLDEKGADRVIVFTRTKHRADAVCRKICRSGLKAEVIHANRSQNQRRIALDNFSQGKTNVLVATDVLARGIDVDVVSYVVNYDLPMVPEDYVHRIGRTGRAGESGWAVSFVTPDNKAMWRDIQKLIGIQIPELELENFDMEAALKESAENAARVTSRKNAQADPEIQAAKKELAKKERKKRRERKRTEDEQAKKRSKRKQKEEQAEFVPYPEDEKPASKHPYQAFMKSAPAWMADPEENEGKGRRKAKAQAKAQSKAKAKAEKQGKDAAEQEARQSKPKAKPKLTFGGSSTRSSNKSAGNAKRFGRKAGEDAANKETANSSGKPTREKGLSSAARRLAFMQAQAEENAEGFFLDSKGMTRSDRKAKPFNGRKAKASNGSKPKASGAGRFSRKPKGTQETSRKRNDRPGKRQKRR